MKIINYLAKLPILSIVALSLALIIIIGIIDYLIVIDISLSIFYLIPITILTWLVNQKAGIIGSIISIGLWLNADLHAKTYPYTWIICWNTSVRLGYFLSAVYLLCLLVNYKKAYKNQQKLASTDTLTGLTNRSLFFKLLQQETWRSLRYQRPLTLVYLDLDNFKLINDRYGHEAGDRLLQLIAKTMKKELRATDTIARLGGDEFAIFLPETNYESAQVVLKKLHHYCLQATQTKFLEIGFSIGAITFSQPWSSTSQMLAQVDSLMYEVKKTGKNNIKHVLVSNPDKN